MNAIGVGRNRRPTDVRSTVSENGKNRAGDEDIPHRRRAIAAYDGANVSSLGPLWNGSSIIADINDGAFDVSFANANAQGSWILTRTGGSAETLYKNGTSVNAYTNASSGLVSVPIYVLARNNNGSEDQNSQNGVNIGYAFYGAGMTATDVTNMRSRLNTYMTAVGASGC